MYVVENELATVDSADAYQVDDVLLVRLSGKKPTPCHVVSIERALTDVEPPTFIARLEIDPRVRCVQVVADYEVARAYRIGGAREQVLVQHAGGELYVEVQQLTTEGVSGGGLPFDPFGEPAEADGYSRAYDLGEAIRDAVSKLPPRGAGIPDWLNSYSVVSIGAEIGGIAGFDHLRVRVRG
jgi:hypothetical protein